MGKTRAEMLDFIGHLMGVSAEDEALTAAQASLIGVALDGAYEDFSDEVSPFFDLDDVPENAVVHLAQMAAADAAPLFGLPPQFSKPRAMLKLMAKARPDDREDISDPVFY